MKVIEKLSEYEDKTLDPMSLKYRLKNDTRKRIEKLCNLTQPTLSVGNRKVAPQKDDDQDSIQKEVTEEDEKKMKIESAREEIQKILDQDETDKHLMDYESLSSLHKHLQRVDLTYGLYFWELIDGCRVFVPEARKNRELEDRLNRLKLEQSHKYYKGLSHSVTPAKGTTATISEDMKELRPIMITLINSLLVVAGTFFFVFKAVEYSMNQPDVIVQVLCSVIASTVVAVAELYFFMKVV